MTDNAHPQTKPKVSAYVMALIIIVSIGWYAFVARDMMRKNALTTALKKGDSTAALAILQEMRDADPSDPEVLSNRGEIYRMRTNLTASIADHNAAIELGIPAYEKKPKTLSFLYFRRGAAYLAADEAELGLADFEEAISLDDKTVPARNALAWTLCTHPDTSLHEPARAIELATKACELSGWKIAATIDTLAAAHAAAGNFEQAIIEQEKALAAADKPVLIAILDVHMKRLLANKAIIEDPVLPDTSTTSPSANSTPSS